MTGPDVILLARADDVELRWSSNRRPGTLVVDIMRGKFVRYGVVVEAAGLRARFLLALVVRPRGIVSREEIVEILWGDREDGGPDHARKTLDLYWLSVRAMMAALGYAAVRSYGRGFSVWPVERVRLDEAELIDIPRFLEVRV